MKNRTRILVVDDEPVVRDGLSTILNHEPDMIVLDVASGVEAIDKALSLKPDVVVMDIGMPVVNGLQAMPKIKEKLPETRCLMLTVSDSEEDLFSALRLGAHGYILKSSSIDQIIDSIRKTASGETVISSRMAGKLAADIRQKTEKKKLSTREAQIMECIREGLSNSQIADRLSVEESTVKTHIHHLLGKLRVKNRTEAVFLAKKHLL